MADGRRRDVLTGLERLLEAGPACAGLRVGVRIGLLTHPASVTREVEPAVDRLASDRRFALAHLFGPEHGLRGEAQDMEAVDGGVDAGTGLPVSSLYGSDAGSLRPRPGDVQALDALICDLQDVGARYYTYVYTLSYLMEAAKESGRPVVVLDRPNPIGGRKVEGPVLEPALASFVGRYPIPVRHGMTAGELAGMFNEAFGIGCDLRVVPMTGWRREMQFEETGLPWVAPSPNMPAVATARVYPGGCLVEGTNLSEGRGTTRPFELVGAPWLRGADLADALASEGLPGVRFRATSFRPMFHKHAGQRCEGVQVHVTDSSTFDPFGAYLAVLREARRQDPSTFDWRREAYEFESDRLAIDLLLGRSDLRPLLESGASVQEMRNAWSAELASFRELRERFLRYPD